MKEPKILYYISQGSWAMPVWAPTEEDNKDES